MQYEFDPDKDEINQAKHGVSLALASELDWDAALVWVDERYEYDEVRMIALAPETGTLYYVAYVDHDEKLKIISLRRAVRREVKHYVENINI
ncbi:MAG: BrnT family toxin [Burkholderiales bacterium]